MLFDEAFQFIDGGAVRVNEDGAFDPGGEILRDFDTVRFASPIITTQKGYAYVWVSNESKTAKVWFDDVRVIHSQGIQIQATDYDPWGSVQRELKTPEEKLYRYGYQGEYSEKDDETGWNHFELREYDPVIGRTLTTDPARQFHSPYSWTRNNPVSITDPTGGVIDDYVFNENGQYVRTDVNNLPDRLVIENSKSCGKSFYEFNDPVTDVAAIKYNIDRFGSEFKNVKFIYNLTDSRINDMMTESGIKPMSAVGRFLFTASESYAGKMDFSAYHLPIDLAKGGEAYTWGESEMFGDKGPIFIFPNQSRAYNYLDAGIWLWGNAVHRLGGSQMNAINWSKTFNPRDSNADQYAIQQGYFYSAGFREPRK